MTVEIWKQISGFSGHYEVSNLGNVRSLNRIVKSNNQWGSYDRYCEGQPVKNVLHKNGYYRVDLAGKLYSVHRLVATVFIQNNNSDLEVNHINGDKLDNRASNLEWVTKSQNIRHADSTGLRKMPNGKDHYMYGRKGNLHHASKKVIDKSSGLVFSTLKEAAASTKYDYRYVSMMLRGRCRNQTTLAFYE